MSEPKIKYPKPMADFKPKLKDYLFFALAMTIYASFWFVPGSVEVKTAPVHKVAPHTHQEFITADTDRGHLWIFNQKTDLIQEVYRADFVQHIGDFAELEGKLIKKKIIEAK